MKFLAKINRNYLVLFISVLFISSLAGYFILRQVILDATKESLVEKKKFVIARINESGEIPNFYPILEVKKLNHASGGEPAFRLMMIKNQEEEETEPYLEYSEEIKIGDDIYLLILRQSSFENEDLLIIISLCFFILISVSMGITFFISRKMNRTTWAAFESNLETIEKFNFTGNGHISLSQSNIEEFDRLNRVIEILTEKLSEDYFALKEFTENASHEIQTPLSVALLHLDEILQQDLNREAFEKTVTAIQTLKRLSTLNQSLILLTKIGNRQFLAEKEVLMNALIKEKLKEFESLFKAKSLEVSYTEESDFFLTIHEQLADVLLNNLISNAINHNVEGGSIELVVGHKLIKICNTGNPNSLSGEIMFNRFTKGNSKSFGLGLAIVKKICDTHHLEISYEKKGRHCFTISRSYHFTP